MKIIEIPFSPFSLGIQSNPTKTDCHIVLDERHLIRRHSSRKDPRFGAAGEQFRMVSLKEIFVPKNLVEHVYAHIGCRIVRVTSLILRRAPETSSGNDVFTRATSCI